MAFLATTSATLWNLLGTAGDPTVGRLGDAVYINSVTGNLIIQRQDDTLASTGLGLSVVRTYNSQGKLNDDNADNWRLGLYRSLAPVTGTVNTAGSTMTRTHADGAEIVFTYDTALSLYRSTDGNALIYAYTGTLLTSVTDASGQVTYLDYVGRNLTQFRRRTASVLNSSVYLRRLASDMVSSDCTIVHLNEVSVKPGKVQGFVDTRKKITL